jgi:NAD(P)-dependent dehydrogenase (short-subunit alcohol dehydrogenase family)
MPSLRVAYARTDRLFPDRVAVLSFNDWIGRHSKRLRIEARDAPRLAPRTPPGAAYATVPRLPAEGLSAEINATREATMGQLDGRSGIVTGAASGIGAATTRVLAREGAKLVLTDLDDAAGLALAAEIDGVYIHHDVTDDAAWPGVVETAEKRFGRLDILVANAGIGIMGPAIDMSLADWRRQMAINVDGVFLSVKYCIPAMRRGGRGGAIVMLSSIAGLRGSAGLAGYSASKGAVRLFAKSMALECAQANDGIRVNSVHPGIIATPIWTKLPAGANAPLDPEKIAAGSVPLGKAGQAEEIANGILFLVSDQSSHMTGSELVIDGGMTAGRITRFGS